MVNALKRILFILALIVTLPAAAQRVRATRSGVPQSPAEWLRQHAIPFATTDPFHATEDLRPLLGIIGNARIVALGDATHGTHELFTMKQRIAPLLVANGFRTIAFEAPYAEFEVIDEYVRTGRGDVATALASNDYFFWDTDELIALIEWARAQNAAGMTPPVRFAGVDVAHPFPAIDRLLIELESLDAATARDVAAHYECFRQFRTNPRAYEGSGACSADVAAVRPLLASRRAIFASDDDFDRALHAARVIEQGELSYATALANRDAAMAENVEYLASAANLILIGHNEHLGRTPYALAALATTASAGTYLAERFGADYFVIGSVIGSGAFNAYEYTGNTAMLRVHSAPVAGADDVATLLRTTSQPRMLVPLRGAPTFGERIMRIAGTNVPSARTPMLLLRERVTEKFDALLFIESTTPTHLRHWPTLP